MKDRINVKVVANAKQNKVKDLGSKIVVYTSAAAEKGKANNDVISQLAEFFSIKAYNIRIIRGQTSSNKVIEVDI